MRNIQIQLGKHQRNIISKLKIRTSNLRYVALVASMQLFDIDITTQNNIVQLVIFRYTKDIQY